MKPATLARKDHTASDAGLRTVAIFEACKGVLVLAVGFGLLRLLHRDVEDFAEHLVRRMHLNPASHIPHVFIEAASRVHDSNLWKYAAGAAAYSIIRFVEAYGLWFRLLWAEWFAIISGCLYIPVEVIELVKHPTRIRLLILVFNGLIVAYLIWVRAVALRRHEQSRITA